MNIERKKLLKQRREKALQNTEDRKLAKENFLTALKASHKADNDTCDAVLGDDNAQNVTLGETSTDDVPSLLLYGRKKTDPSKAKTSKKHIPIRVKPLESSMDDPPADENVTGTAKGHAFDPTDVRVYEFFIQGTPNPKDLEGVEGDQLLDIQ